MSDENLEACEHRLETMRHWLEAGILPPEVEGQVRKMVGRMKEHIARRVLIVSLEPFVVPGRTTVGEAKATVQKLVGDPPLSKREIGDREKQTQVFVSF